MRLFSSPVALVATSAATLSAFALLLCAAPAANAQANLSFTGGSGTPLTLLLSNPVTYTVTTTNNNGAPFFLFKNTGNPFNNFFSVTGTITFSINGGANQTITDAVSGGNAGVLNPNDIYIFGPFPGVTVNDIVTLSSGTLTTTGNIAAAAPASGSFTTFITSNNTSQLSSNGVAGPAAAAPEPGTLPLLGMGIISGMGTLGVARRRKAKR